MDHLTLYQRAILDLLNEYATYLPLGIRDVRYQVISDTESHHYVLIRIGWDEHEAFLHQVIMHFDLEGGKIWIRANNTDLDVGRELTDRGVPASDIVVGFQPPQYRAFSGYSVG